ncbi:MAG TPA: thioredoxin domain-containing protein, partial [Mycobacterium sp.]|nr:thioredoxin domain-containing protein [Mycobacterium sp.]
EARLTTSTLPGSIGLPNSERSRMRYRSGALAMLAACLCTLFTTASPAHADVAGTALTPDHYGVVAGSADAPVQLEFFCDPQCPDCAQFESASGAAIGDHLGAGHLAVTYRWLTFLDAKRDNDTSARVGNALMLAADPATSATAYQAFVSDLYRNRDPDGDGPGADSIASMARESGVPDQVADRMAAGQSAVDSTAMNAFNRARLVQVNPERPGTPTVYDLRANKLVDTDDVSWLDQLMQPG